jgi:hypothetical protein
MGIEGCKNGHTVARMGMVRNAFLSVEDRWKTKTNYMVWVHEQTIPTEQPPLFGEASANLCGWMVPRDQCEGTLWPYSRLSRPKLLLFFQVAPQLYLQGWVHPVPDPLLLRKSGSAGNWTWASGSVARNSDHQTTEVVETDDVKVILYYFILVWLIWICN